VFRRDDRGVAGPLPLEGEDAVLHRGPLQHLHRALTGRLVERLAVLGEARQRAHVGHADLFEDLGAALDPPCRDGWEAGVGQEPLGVEAVEHPRNRVPVGQQVQPARLHREARAGEDLLQEDLDAASPPQVDHQHPSVRHVDRLRDMGEEA
jgi:hypothetical protein